MTGTVGKQRPLWVDWVALIGAAMVVVAVIGGSLWWAPWTDDPVDAAAIVSTTVAKPSTTTTTVIVTTTSSTSTSTTVPDPDAGCKQAFRAATVGSGMSFPSTTSSGSGMSFPSARSPSTASGMSFPQASPPPSTDAFATISACTEEQWNRISATIPIGATLQALCDGRMNAPAAACDSADAARVGREEDERRREEAEAEEERRAATTTRVPTTRAPASNSSRITAAEFAAIQAGMTVAQVRGIVGGPGTVMAETTIAGFTGLVLGWTGEGGSLGANAIVQFQDGVVITKAQFGL